MYVVAEVVSLAPVVVALSYHVADVDVMDYLRAVMRSNELSVRSLNLTTDAILLNPSNYTVWYAYSMQHSYNYY